MQIEVNRKEFISALNVGGSMAGKTKTIPALDYAKIIDGVKYGHWCRIPKFTKK